MATALEELKQAIEAHPEKKEFAQNIIKHCAETIGKNVSNQEERTKHMETVTHAIAEMVNDPSHSFAVRTDSAGITVDASAPIMGGIGRSHDDVLTVTSDAGQLKVESDYSR